MNLKQTRINEIAAMIGYLVVALIGLFAFWLGAGLVLAIPIWIYHLVGWLVG
jgi:hypothetical protein